MTISKVYLGEFDMPHEIEAAAHAFYEAVRKCGYFTGNVDVCPSLNSCGVRLTITSNGEIKDAINAELNDGEWKRVGWVDSDD